MPHNENSRVKIPALVHFTRLGYQYISLKKYEGVVDSDTNILIDVLRDAINRINATALTTEDVQKIVNVLKAMLENNDLGREFYSILLNGYHGLCREARRRRSEASWKRPRPSRNRSRLTRRRRAGAR